MVELLIVGRSAKVVLFVVAPKTSPTPRMGLRIVDMGYPVGPAPRLLLDARGLMIVGERRLRPSCRPNSPVSGRPGLPQSRIPKTAPLGETGTSRLKITKTTR